MARIALIYVGVVAGLIAGAFVGLFVLDPLNPFSIYAVVPLSGAVGGGVFALLSKPLKRTDDLSVIGVVLTGIAGVVGAVLAFVVGAEAFRLIDPYPSRHAANWNFEDAIALLCLGPLGGLFAILATYKFLKRRSRR